MNIASDKIGNPLLIELLRKLTGVFSGLNREYFIIGATARDLILLQLEAGASTRRTRDLDISIAIPDWDAFEEIERTLVASGFEKDTHMRQRFYYKEYELDLVPYGPVAKDDGYIYWPPEEDIGISVKGFDEVLANAITLMVDNDFEIKVASLHGLFVLKFNAWLDRHISTSKDAEDMSFIISNYFDANYKRDVHQEVYDMPDFDLYAAGAYWLAHDIAEILTQDQLAFYKEKIDSELAKEENSRLLNQIIDNGQGVSFEQARRAFRTISAVFQKVICHED